MLKSLSRTGRIACISAALMLTCATIAPAYAQDLAPEQLNELIDRLRPADSGAVEKLLKDQTAKLDQFSREVLTTLGRQSERLSALEAQLSVLTQMQLQLVGAVGKIEVTQNEALRTKSNLDTAVAAIPPEQQELAASVEAFKTIANSIPTTPDELAKLGPEQIKEIEIRTRSAKSKADEALENYVENVVIKKIQEGCPDVTPQQQRQLVTAARNGSTDDELKRLGTEFKCSISDDLIRQLAAARNAEEAQAAFQQAMTSLMMMAIMSGNPYVAAIAAVIMLIMALFGDGNGDGDGDGQDDEPGGGEETGPVVPVDPVNPVEPVDPVDPVAPAPVNPNVDGIYYKSGNGCLPSVQGDVLTLTPAEGVGVIVPIDVNISQIKIAEGSRFPTSWTTGEIVLHACDFGERSVTIVWTVVPNAPVCSEIQPLPEDVDGKLFVLKDGAYAQAADSCSVD